MQRPNRAFFFFIHSAKLEFEKCCGQVLEKVSTCTIFLTRFESSEFIFLGAEQPKNIHFTAFTETFELKQEVLLCIICILYCKFEEANLMIWLNHY